MDEVAELQRDAVWESHTLAHPFRSGPRIDRNDIDGLCDELYRVKGELRELHEYDQRLRRALDSLSTCDTKTRRVVGSRWEAKLVSPDDYWSQADLKRCVKEWPELAEAYVRVSQYAPNLVEIRKLESSDGSESFNLFKAAILAARSPNNSPPTVTLVERS